ATNIYSSCVMLPGQCEKEWELKIAFFAQALVCFFFQAEDGIRDGLAWIDLPCDVREVRVLRRDIPKRAFGTAQDERQPIIARRTHERGHAGIAEKIIEAFDAMLRQHGDGRQIERLAHCHVCWRPS